MAVVSCAAGVLASVTLLIVWPRHFCGSVIHSVKSAVDHYSSSLRLPNCSINFSLRPWLGTSVLGYLINVATPHCSLCVSCYSIFQLLVIIFVVCDACVDM